VVSKSEQVAGLLKKIELGWSIPAPLEQADLLEQGLHAVLQRHFDAKKAAATIKNLKARYPDWNELRVAQSQEIVEAGKFGARGAKAARDTREYLQEVFQHSHGLSLEFLREDPQATARFASSVPFIGLGTVHYLMWLAQKGELPVTGGLVRVLDRLGLVARTASLKKAREGLKPVIPARTGEGDNVELEFAVRLGEVGSRWCDARKPLCHLCVLVEDCRHGKKVYRDWKVQQQRLEAQRAREAARMEALRLKEQAKAEREAERARKKAAADEQKRQRERERQEKVAAKKRQAEEKQRARVEAQKKREEEARRREQAKLAREKAERERKKAAQKPAKKAAKKPSGAARKKGGAKKAAAAGRKR
jgi:endonuclease III